MNMRRCGAIAVVCASIVFGCGGKLAEEDRVIESTPDQVPEDPPAGEPTEAEPSTTASCVKGDESRQTTIEEHCEGTPLTGAACRGRWLVPRTCDIAPEDRDRRRPICPYVCGGFKGFRDSCPPSCERMYPRGAPPFCFPQGDFIVCVVNGASSKY